MASVKQAWIKKYGEEEGLRRYSDLKKSYGRTKEQLIAQYGEDYVENLMRKKACHSLKYYVEKHGEELGKDLWEKKIKKKTETQSLRREGGKIYKNGRTLSEYQERYGLEDGYNRWLARNKNQSYKVSRQRYVDDYGEEGLSICKKIKDNTSLDAFVERYGEEEGSKRYREKCKKSAVTEEKMILRYGEEFGKEKYKKWLLAVTQTRAKLFSRGYSKISQDIFWKIYNTLHADYQLKCYFAELNEEYQFFVNKEGGYPNKIIRVDFKCGNAIIEYDGTYWHNKTIEIDMLRDALLQKKGYVIKRINEIDNNIIEECKQFIYENAQLRS